MSIAQAMRLPQESALRTFLEDEKLPPLPLPSLSHTLERYVDSVRPLVSASEFAKTQEIVKKFESGEGKVLHEKLKAKAESERNWVEQWWEDKAYLENRRALVPFCSMTGIGSFENIWKFEPGRMLKYASLYMYYTVEMWGMLRSELLIPTQTADGKTTFSMNQFRRLFNCCRVPLPGRDRLDAYFKTEKEGSCPSHITVACNGHLFVLDAVEDGTFLNPLEWERQLEIILKEALKAPGDGIARLTCDDRDIWAKNSAQLKRLSGENAHNLHLIESSMYLLILEPNVEPQSHSEISMLTLTGDYKNLWADKSSVVTFFGNGQSGGLAEHCAFDGIVSITNTYYTYQSLIDSNGEWTKPTTVRSLSPPRKLNFILNSAMKMELESADLRQSIARNQVIVIREEFAGFGKNYVVKNRINPDTFVQMALQLTYYRMHKKLAPCYETATTRGFYHGRTETMRPCTSELANWVHAMSSNQTKAEEKVRLLQIAAKRHDGLMKEAREAQGCDRHLFGLYCVAEENQMPVPDLFKDASYVKSGGGGNFVLSTSLTGYTPLSGGVAPMCLDGYGAFYNICRNSIYIIISVMRDSSETSASKFFTQLCETFYLMQNVLESANASSHSKPKSHL